MIEKGAVIREGAIIGPLVYIGPGAGIGKNARLEHCLVYPAPAIQEGVRLKNEVIAPSKH